MLIGWLKKHLLLSPILKIAVLLNISVETMIIFFFDEYKVQMEEVHHVHKKDAPSGTAITLAEGLIQNHPKYTTWKLDETQEQELGIFAIRKDEVPGTHSVFYRSDVDEIEIKHTAFSRDGFALGAVVAAEWIIGRTGNFTMNDVLGL